MKRTYDDIRVSLLKAISGKQKTINEISRISKVNWKTVQRHIVFFKGSGFVNEVFSSPYVRILEITELGRAELKRIEEGMK
jgi:predicted transcriptional regulator